MNGLLNIHPKVVGGAMAGSVATLIIWILGLYGITVPDVASGALVVFISALGGYFSPLVKKELIPAPPASG